MAPTQVEVKAIKSRCDSVKKGVDHAECPHNVKKMLCSTLSVSVGTPKADRHPFNERFVAMIEEVLEGEQARLTAVVTSEDAHFAELSPAKATREAALEQAKNVAAEQAEALAAAKQAVTEVGATVKAAAAELAEAKKAQKSGDAEIEGVAAKKCTLERIATNSLKAIVDGRLEDDRDVELKGDAVKDVLGLGKSFGFDSSLMSTSAQVLEKPAGERGAFDATCLQQLEDAFTGEIAKLEGEIAEGAPAKAARAAAVEQAEANEQAAVASQIDLKGKAAAAKEAKAAADAAAKDAAKSLADFMPDLKVAGDSLDGAKAALEAYIAGPRAAFSELKEFKDGDFKPVPKPKKVAVEETAEGEGMAADGEATQEAAESPSKRARTE